VDAPLDDFDFTVPSWGASGAWTTSLAATYTISDIIGSFTIS
jgi:hypothetical protein